MFQHEIIHKRRPTAWHRDNTKAPCGVTRLINNPKSYLPKIIVLKESYIWKDVTCNNCLKFLEVVKVETLNKFKESYGTNGFKK